jgi:hypothetical protein
LARSSQSFHVSLLIPVTSRLTRLAPSLLTGTPRMSDLPVM